MRKKPISFIAITSIINTMAQGSLKVLALLVCASWCAFHAAAGKNPAADSQDAATAAAATFNVGSYGARADGQTDDSNVIFEILIMNVFFS
jgi:polygalacturonase